jgi:hypothetical protein
MSIRPGLLWLPIAFVTLVGACRGSTSESARPAWMSRGANLEHPDFVLVIGTCRAQTSQEAARRCALEDAHRQLASVFHARGGLVRDEHHESRMGTVTRGNTNVLTVVHDAWILVGYPRAKLQPTPR